MKKKTTHPDRAAFDWLAVWVTVCTVSRQPVSPVYAVCVVVEMKGYWIAVGMAGAVVASGVF
ncbi:hypothetical protein, partial [Acidovorax sp. Root217]|uniref:hypothetical protein n=1 Tax=Acidovorax sp. Root217 TaxID=1736492 RepID=UPI001F20677D